MLPKLRNGIQLIRFREKGSKVIHPGLEHFFKIVQGRRGFKELLVKQLLGLLDSISSSNNFKVKEVQLGLSLVVERTILGFCMIDYPFYIICIGN